MSEVEWATCQNGPAMLEFIRGNSGDRKPQLLACACARYRWSGHVEDEYQRPVAAAEQCADGLPSGTGDNFNDAAILGLIAKIAEARVLTREIKRLAVACSQGTKCDKRFDPSPWGQSGIFKALAREGSIRFIAERAASRTAQSLSLRSEITHSASS